MPLKTITVGELRVRMLEQLSELNDDDEIMFGGGALSFYRIKNRGNRVGPQLIDVEFNEVFTVDIDPDLLD